MDYRVIFKDTFLANLEGIVRFISVHDSSAARKLGDIIIRDCERLRFFPERHPRVHQRAGIRRFIVKNHFKVFYRVHGESRTVEVLRCWDGRRETDPVL